MQVVSFIWFSVKKRAKSDIGTNYEPTKSLLADTKYKEQEVRDKSMNN